MKTLGMIGGIAPESTIEYYRTIIALYRQRRTDDSYPPMIINSINLQRLITLVTANERAALVEWFHNELLKLKGAGADFAIISSNTPHLVFDELQRISPLPLISIVEPAATEAARLKWKRVGLFGTRFTMRAEFYPAVFSKQGIGIVTPTPEEQEYIHSKYMGELIHGVFLDETRESLLRIAHRMQSDDSIDGLVLGGTELPLILQQAPAGLPFLDTTKVHAARAVDEMFA